ncbi:hypothetical protein Q8A67_023605 [Cirrhinus molitorella]|nr:hypothetical protein Q8A67_023605 [Cirrhinus molitorella]
MYQEVPGSDEVTSVLYVYTDFIMSKESSQASDAAQPFEDFGYSLVRPTCRKETAVLYCVTNDRPTACPDAGVDK